MTPTQANENNEKFIKCDCHGEFIRLDYDPDFVSFDMSIWTLEASSTPSWKTKLRWIWRIITNNSPYGDQVVINKDKAKELADYLIDKIKD
jgi:hypothetical protein